MMKVIGSLTLLSCPVFTELEKNSGRVGIQQTSEFPITCINIRKGVNIPPH